MVGKINILYLPQTIWNHIMTETPDRLTKSELVRILSEDLDLTIAESRAIMDKFLDLLVEGLQQERKILISDFGSFQVSVRNSFQGYNPHNGEVITIPRRMLPGFKCGKSLKQRLNPNV